MSRLIQKLLFRTLILSKVFKYWYKQHLTELMYDLEIYDIQKDYIINKYSEKLKRSYL